MSYKSYFNLLKNKVEETWWTEPFRFSTVYKLYYTRVFKLYYTRVFQKVGGESHKNIVHLIR